MRIVSDQTDAVAAWVAQRIPGLERGFGPCAAIGLADEENKPVAGFVFSAMQPWPDGITMQFSMASANPKWLMTRKTIARVVLSYPFHQLNVWKLWTAVQHVNPRTTTLSKAFGFKQEAILRDQFGRGKHAVISRLFRNDYDKIYGVLNGQTVTTATHAA